MSTGKMVVTISLCTNDEHGNNTGRVDAAHLDDALELQWCEIGTGPKYSIDKTNLKLSRMEFSILGSTAWYGNWCWTGVTMTLAEAARLLNYLSTEDRWSLDGGWCELKDLYDAGKVTPESLQELGRASR